MTQFENVQRELDVKQQLIEETNALDCHPPNEAPGDDILTLPGALMIYQWCNATITNATIVSGALYKVTCSYFDIDYCQILFS